MTDIPDGEVTALLAEIRHTGERQALEDLFRLLYPRLRELAGTCLAGWHGADSLGPTGLLHEAFLRLVATAAHEKAPNRAYILGAATQAMRRILIDRARRRRTLKQGGWLVRQPADALLEFYEQQRIDPIVLRDALECLDKVHARTAQVVTLRTMGGYTVAEVAELLQVSISTVENDYRFGISWLYDVLGEGADHVV